jgi:hypothetical protein
MPGAAQADIESAETVRSSGVDLPRCLGVVHVPKCAGTATRLALENSDGFYGGPLYFDEDHFGSRELVAALPADRQELVASPADLARLASSCRVVFGHYSASSLMAAGCGSLAIQVREPRTRVLSLYRFWRSQDPAERDSWGVWGRDLVSCADLPLGQFLAGQTVWPAVDNHIARQVAGGLPLATTIAALSESGSILEWYDRSDRFVGRVLTFVGDSAAPALRRVNVTEAQDDGQPLDRDGLQRLEMSTARDRLLIDGLMDAGLLERRTEPELQAEFESTAERMGFRLP